MRRRAQLSLRQRLLLAVLLPAALIAAAVSAVVLARGTRALDDALRQRALAIVSFLAPAAEYGVISGNRAGLAPLLAAVMAQREVTAAAIYDDAGELLAGSGPLGVADRAVLRAAESAMVLARAPDTLVGLAPVIPTPLQIDDVELAEPRAPAAPELRRRPAGWVYVALDARPAAREKNAIVAVTLGLVLAALGVTAAVALRLAGSVARPVANLAAAVDRMSAGSLDVQLPEQAGTPELAALERGFNAMARSLADIQRTLQSRIDAATAQLAYQAHHDPLTGLPNRRFFEQAIEDAVAASRRASDHGALCFIDLDRFKIVNDTCGHAAGDELLRRLAHLIRGHVREQDVLCRVGGDEFALILRGCSRDDAVQVAEGLRQAVAAYRFAWEGRHFSVGASIGLIPIDGSHSGPADVVVAADIACYAAKKSGRNRVVEHAAGGGARPGRPALAIDFGDATMDLEERLELHVQPITALDSAIEHTWLEVLLRVRGAEGEAQLPGHHLAGLDTGRGALEIDGWIAEQACAAAARLQALAGTGRPVTLSLNLSRTAVAASEVFFARLQAALRHHGLAPGQFVIELGMDLVERIPDDCREVVRRARALGARTALQRVDGGGVRHLAALRPDYVKVSLATLIAAYGLEAGCNLAQALAGMAATLGIKAIASEVEDPLLLEVLAAYGFELIQGHAVAPPMPLDYWQAPAGAGAG